MTLVECRSARGRIFLVASVVFLAGLLAGCADDENRAQLTVVKAVVNDNGGTAVAGDFTITVTGTNVSQGSFPGAASPGTTVTLDPGTYSVSETSVTGYTESQSADCSGTIAAGETRTCTLTNDDIAPQLIVIKSVVNDSGGAATAGDFTLTVTGTNPSPASFAGEASPGTTVTLDAGDYSVSETGPSGYSSTQSADCAGSISIGESLTCTVTNDDNFTLTILHNNDAESQLIDAGSGLEDFGGVARFATVVSQLRAQAAAGSGTNHGAVLVSSGDNFLAGPEFNASLQKGVPFYDSIALDLIGYDAIAIGNHEFDFGPDVLADFISGFNSPPFVTANLGFSQEPELQAFVDSGRIVKSAVVEVGSAQIGIVGATTPELRSISSPRNVTINSDVAGAIQTEVDALTAQGVDKIVLISHLQSITEDLDLAPQLSNVDVMVAGGGDELLSNEGDLLIPGDEGNVFGAYPLTATGGDGAAIPVVTTTGAYRYVGRLVVEFDDDGNILNIDTDNSGPVRVSGTGPDAVTPNAEIDAQVVGPVEAAVAQLDQNVIGTTQVALDGRRSEVRTKETNEGNLVADALLFQGVQRAASFGQPVPDVALQNGGGIRNDNIIAAGNLTELDTFDILPFSNFVSIIPNIPRAQFKEILENAVSAVEFGAGRFAQIAGFTMVWDANGTAQQVDDAGTVLTPGTRVRQVTLDGGTQIVVDGAVVAGPDIHVATIDFLARGGDQYPFRGADFTTIGITYQGALRDYIENSAGLNGTVTSVQYPEGGEGRITRLN